MVVGDVQVDLGQAVVDQLGDRARFVEHDVTDEAGWDAIVGEAVSAFDGVDALVNNAAREGGAGLVTEHA